MTDVFISYKREERDAARRLAEALQKHGFKVWWDAEILPGEHYRTVTFDILQSCRATVVIWSPQSVNSSWVLDEAQRALDRGVLIPVHLEPIEAYPLGFGQVHSHDLTQWNADADHPALAPVVSAVRRLAGQGQAAPAPPVSNADIEAEVGFWRGVRDSGEVEEFNAYLARYPTGMFADLARRRAGALGERATGPAAPPAQTASKRGPQSLYNTGAQSTHDQSAGTQGAGTQGEGTQGDGTPGAGTSSAPAQSVALNGAHLAFIAACIFVSGFLAWPIANAALGLEEIFYAEDYAHLLSFNTPQSIFIATPLLTGAAFVYDRAVAAWAAQGRAANIVQFGVLAVLIVFFLASLGMRDNAGRETQLAVWMLMAWAAATFVRPAMIWAGPRIAAHRTRIGGSR